MKLKPGMLVVSGPPLHLRRGEREIFLLEGDLKPWFLDLLNLLDGRDRAAISTALPGVKSSEIDKAIDQLKTAGALTENDETPHSRITLKGKSPLWCWLEQLVLVSDEENLVTVAHQETISPASLREFNREMLGKKLPWMLLSLQDDWARIGPIFIPGETSCYECYQQRLMTNRMHPKAHQAWETMDRPVGTMSTPVYEAAVAAMAAVELTNFLKSGASQAQLAGRVLIWNLRALEGTIEPVWIVPYCHACRS